MILSENVSTDKSFTKIKFSDKDLIKKCINNFLLQDDCPGINIYGENEDILLKEISMYFSLVNAAGGIVNNKSRSILLINRLCHWDFPKGKKEEYETIEQAALREVCEECGITGTDLNISRFIKNTYHIYQLNDKFVLKETSWFEMYFSGSYTLKPQTEEYITEVKWIKKNELKIFIANSYNSIKDLADYYLLLST
ncbi:MAG: NUDIX domain-containing protein [Bacteroidales bacterium]|nr:NUDIX domain-containing protein [Bacteroidales bacterium]